MKSKYRVYFDIILKIHNIMKLKLNLKFKPRTQGIIKKIKLKPEYTIDYLDQHHSASLFGLKDSWSEVRYRLKSDAQTNYGDVWDVELLLNIIANQLNATSMTNPKPQLPYNPFNRVPFSDEFSLQLRDLCFHHHLKVNLAVAVWMNMTPPLPLAGQVQELVTRLQEHLRFRLVNEKDSQDTRIGYWVKNTARLTAFEWLYNKANQTPFFYMNPQTGLMSRHRHFRRNWIKVVEYPPETTRILDEITYIDTSNQNAEHHNQ
jgi:hypothetical protein